MDTKTFRALAEPNRLRIVEALRERPRSVNEIATQLKLRQPQASKHLHTLRKAGLVTARPIAQQRVYALRPQRFKQLNDWLGSFELYWTERFAKLDDYLEELKKP